MSNWIDTKEAFRRLSRMGVTMVAMPPGKLEELGRLADQNLVVPFCGTSDDRRYEKEKSFQFYGILVKSDVPDLGPDSGPLYR